MYNYHMNSKQPLSQSAVDEALDNAIENGYPVNTWTAFEVADDLTELDCDFEGYDRPDLIPFVEDWQARHPA